MAICSPNARSKAERIVQILRDNVFTVTGPPLQLHSDQGRNFESHILSDLCQAFGVKKSRTTPYHPMGDGLVERMNRSLLTLLRTYVESENLWEEHLQLLLFVYRTTRHSSTGFSPYEILFGSNPPNSQIPLVQSSFRLDPSDYCENLKAKLAQLREIVDANMVQSSSQQQRSYRSSEHPTPLKCGQQVLLENPRAGKLDPRWSGPWIVKRMKGSTSMLLSKGASEQLVHVNRVRPLLIEDSEDSVVPDRWSPPFFHYENDHSTEENAQPDRPSDSHNDSGPQIITCSGRIVKPPQRYGT